MFIVSWDSFQCGVGIVLFTTKFGTFSFSLFLILWCGGEKFICFHVAVDAGQIVRARADEKSNLFHFIALFRATLFNPFSRLVVVTFTAIFPPSLASPGWRTITLYTNSDTNLFITHRAIINCFEISETTPNRPDGVYQTATERVFLFSLFYDKNLFTLSGSELQGDDGENRKQFFILRTADRYTQQHRRLRWEAFHRHTHVLSLSLSFPFHRWKNERDCVTSRHFRGLASTYVCEFWDAAIKRSFLSYSREFETIFVDLRLSRRCDMLNISKIRKIAMRMSRMWVGRVLKFVILFFSYLVCAKTIRCEYLSSPFHHSNDVAATDARVRYFLHVFNLSNHIELALSGDICRFYLNM